MTGKKVVTTAKTYVTKKVNSIKKKIKRKALATSRKAIALAGSLYLKKQNCELAAKMFSYALRDKGHGNFSAQYKEIKKLLKKKIKKSDAYDKYCSQLIKYKQNKKTKKDFDPDVIEFKANKDKDLYYSVQHASVDYDVKNIV